MDEGDSKPANVSTDIDEIDAKSSNEESDATSAPPSTEVGGATKEEVGRVSQDQVDTAMEKSVFEL